MKRQLILVITLLSMITCFINVEAYRYRRSGYRHRDGGRVAAGLFGGAATGALLGGALGGGRGAAIGAGVGAVAGATDAAASRDEVIYIEEDPEEEIIVADSAEDMQDDSVIAESDTETDEE